MILVNRDTSILARSKGFDDWCLYTTELRLFDEIESIESISNLQTRTKKLVINEYGSVVCKNSDINEAMSYIRGLSEDEDYICIPTQSDLQKWLRETHNLHINIGSTIGESFKTEWILYRIEILNSDIKTDNLEIGLVQHSYEQCLEFGLQQALKLLPDKKINDYEIFRNSINNI